MDKTFFEHVYEIVSEIPVGKVATYKTVARLAGNEKAARAVGTAMKNNPDMANIPCHRVVGSDGKMHGYAFGEGISSKIRLLKSEGVKFVGQRVDLNTSCWARN